MPPLERKVGASAAQVPRGSFKLKLHLNGLLRAHVIHGMQDRPPNILTRHELLVSRRLGGRKTVVMDGPAHGKGEIQNPGLGALDLDVMLVKGHIGVHLVEIDRLLRPDGITHIGVRDAGAVDQAGPAPPAQPGETDADLVHLQHDVLPVGIAINRQPVRQQGAGGVEQEIAHRNRKRKNVPPLNLRQKIDLGHLGQAEKTKPEHRHQHRHRQGENRAEPQPGEKTPHVMTIRFHLGEFVTVKLAAKERREHKDVGKKQ